MAEGILRQSYDSSVRKIYPLTVIDGILRRVDVNVMDAQSRGAYAIIDSMKNYDVDFKNGTLSNLVVCERTWNGETRDYSDVSTILSVSNDGLSANRTSIFRGNVIVDASSLHCAPIEVGKFGNNSADFKKFGKFGIKEGDNGTIWGEIELDINEPGNSFFVVNNAGLEWKADGSTGKGLSVNGTSLTYDGGRVDIENDVSVGKNLNVGLDSSIGGNLYVGGSITFDDTLYANKDASIHNRLYVYDPGFISDPVLLDVSKNGTKIATNTTITKDLTVNGAITATGASAHNLLYASNELNLAGNFNNNDGSLFFNYRAGRRIDQIYMCAGIGPTTVSNGNLTKVIVKSLQIGAGNTSRYISSDTQTNMYVSIDESIPLVVEKDSVRRGATYPTDLGTPSYPWKNGYFDNISSNNISLNDVSANSIKTQNNIFCDSITTQGTRNYMSSINEKGWYKIGKTTSISSISDAASNTNIFIVNRGYTTGGTEGYIISFVNDYRGADSGDWSDGSSSVHVQITQISGNYGIQHLITKFATICKGYDTEYYMYYAGSSPYNNPVYVSCIGTASPIAPTRDASMTDSSVLKESIFFTDRGAGIRGDFYVNGNYDPSTYGRNYVKISENTISAYKYDGTLTTLKTDSSVLINKGLSVDGDITILHSGNLTVPGNLTVAGTTWMRGDLNVENGGSIYITDGGNLGVSGDLEVAGTTSMRNTLTVTNGGMKINSGGLSVISGTTALNGKLTVNSGGAEVKGKITAQNDLDVKGNITAQKNLEVKGNFLFKSLVLDFASYEDLGTRKLTSGGIIRGTGRNNKIKWRIGDVEDRTIIIVTGGEGPGWKHPYDRSEDSHWGNYFTNSSSDSDSYFKGVPGGIYYVFTKDGKKTLYLVSSVYTDDQGDLH